MSATTGRPVAVGSVPAYAQGDPRWGSQYVGEGRESFASVGCMVTSLAAAAGTLWFNRTPVIRDWGPRARSGGGRATRRAL